MAIITLSEMPGNTPPTHVAVEDHKPPLVVEKILAGDKVVALPDKGDINK